MCHSVRKLLTGSVYIYIYIFEDGNILENESVKMHLWIITKIGECFSLKWFNWQLQCRWQNLCTVVCLSKDWFHHCNISYYINCQSYLPNIVYENRDFAIRKIAKQKIRRTLLFIGPFNSMIPFNNLLFLKLSPPIIFDRIIISEHRTDFWDTEFPLLTHFYQI